MTRAKSAGESARESAARTLGDLLYADETKPYVSEIAWTALVQSIVNGDQDALHELYERTHRLVFTLMVRMSNDLATSEELTLDVFHDVWRRASTYDAAGGSVVGWIMNQARSRAIDRLRFEQRKKRVNPYSDDPITSTTAPDPHEANRIEEQKRLLRGALQGLTAQE